MKMNNLEKIYLCLKNGAPSIELSADLIARARKPLDKMLELSVNIGKR